MVGSTEGEMTHQERPIQIYGTDRIAVEAWAKSVLGRAVSDQAKVEIYEIREQLVAEVK